MPKKTDEQNVSIFDLLSEASEEEPKSRRAELLESMGLFKNLESFMF